MQTAYARYILLTLVFVGGAALYAVLGDPLGAGTARWPLADSFYAVEPWTVGPQVDDSNNGTGVVSRVLRHPSGASATLSIVSNQAPKIYGPGAEVPFLGNGYTVPAMPPDVATLQGEGVQALVATRGTERWLVMFAYGERRGLLGNGPLAWVLALGDGVLGRPNDYYKLYLAARTDTAPASADQQVADLAHVLFPRIAAWYAA